MSSKISRYIQCTGPLAAKAALVRQGASPRGRADVAPAAVRWPPTIRDEGPRARATVADAAVCWPPLQV
ncbi:unnamed protein product [Prorocentrum cordatum]|uniref:Uncharacterized protein n=1 Tax=Prorocentrum cordatum TaxID=2364126 RepID=A0ABN9VI40_9DINO|nr:unnamed protein product [Polarella glacialis]